MAGPAYYWRRNRRVRIIIHTNICRKSDLIISELSVGGSSSCLGVKFEQNSMMIPCLLADRPTAQVKSAKFSKKCSESLLANFAFTANPLYNEMRTKWLNIHQSMLRQDLNKKRIEIHSLKSYQIGNIENFSNEFIFRPTFFLLRIF